MDCQIHSEHESIFACRLADERSLSPKAVAIILLYGASLLLINLGSARVLTYHETLFAQPAKEMLATGNWILPTMGGIPSNHKPPLTHWSIAATMGLLRSESEWVVRLPIVLATLATAWMVAALAARWHGQAIGLLAGLIQLTTFYTLMQARLAESDMLLCTLVTAAMLTFATATIDVPIGKKPAPWLAWLFYVLAALAFLTKGPLGPVLIFGGCGLYFLWERDLGILRFLISPVGWILFVVGVLAWPLTAYWSHPEILADWRMHHLGRFQGDMGGQKPALFYCYMIPLLLLPWTPFALKGLWAGGKRRRLFASPSWRLLASWFLAGFIVFSMAAWKHKHYVIPILPPLSIVASWGLARHVFGRGERRLAAVLSMVAVLLAAGGGIVALSLSGKDLAPVAAPVIAAAAIGLCASCWLEIRRKPVAQLAALFAATWLVAVLIQSRVMPKFDSYRDQTDLARRVNNVVPDSAPLYLVGLPENQITYYLRRPLVRIDDHATFMTSIAGERTDELFILGPQRSLELLAEQGAVEVLDRCPTIRKIMTPADRIMLFKLTAGKSSVAATESPRID